MECLSPLWIVGTFMFAIAFMSFLQIRQPALFQRTLWFSIQSMYETNVVNIFKHYKNMEIDIIPGEEKYLMVRFRLIPHFEESSRYILKETILKNLHNANLKEIDSGVY